MKTVDDYKFSIEPTPCGCWAVMEAPSGRVQRKLFRQTCYGNAVHKAKSWISYQKEVIDECVAIELAESQKQADNLGDKPSQTPAMRHFGRLMS